MYWAVNTTEQETLMDLVIREQRLRGEVWTITMCKR